MKVSLNWLKNYVHITLPTEELAEKLTMVGLEVKAISNGKGKDEILDIEVTPNRSDCLSILGIAREVAATTGFKLQSVASRVEENELPPQNAKRKAKSTCAEVEIQDKQGCSRYTGRLISNIKVGPSPLWMQRRLLNLGLKPINNVVDITNYVMLERGQPLHAFDFKKIKSVKSKSQARKIIIRKAKAGEKIITLDNEEKELDGQTLIIADCQKPLAVAGVIGGQNSGIDENTNTVFLESAYFKPLQIRKTSRKLAISTESSYRFERGVCSKEIDLASERAAQLLEEFAEGKLEEVVWAGRNKKKKQELELRYDQVKRILGIDISEERIKKILTTLQFEISFSDKKRIRVKIPYFRSDIERESDLIEEIARIFGFQNIPLVMPPARISLFEKSKSEIVSKKLKEILISSGFGEIITNSLTSDRAIVEQGGKEKKIIHIFNPLTIEQEIMRPSLFSNALNVLAWNFNYRAERVKIFELGKIYYYSEKGEAYEDKNLLLTIFGKKENVWYKKGKEFKQSLSVPRLDFYDIKGIVEKILFELGISNYSFTEGKDSRFSRLCAVLKIKNKKIGILGEVSKDILVHYGLKQRVYLCEINFKCLVDLSNFKKKFSPISKYPTICRDIALLVKDKITCGEIISIIRKNGGELINNIHLFDIYQGKQVPRGHKSLAFSIEYQGKEETLTDTEINNVDNKIRQQLSKKLKATTR